MVLGSQYLKKLKFLFSTKLVVISMKDLYLEIRQLIVYQIINILDCISVPLDLFLLLKMNCAKKHQRHTINYTKKYYQTIGINFVEG